MIPIQKGDIITIIHDQASHLYSVIAIGIEPDFAEPYTTTLKLIRLTRTPEESDNA